jgi:hypothetical protein
VVACTTRRDERTGVVFIGETKGVTGWVPSQCLVGKTIGLGWVGSLACIIIYSLSAT